MSTRRADFRTALFGILSDFRAANPTLLRQVYRARPASFAPPLAYVGLFSEPSVAFETGNRLVRPDIRAQLVVVEGVYENAETADRLDALVDALLTFLVTEHSRVSGATLLEPSGGGEDVDLAIGETTYAASIIPVRLNAVD